MTADETIARCTRNGYTAWQQVANQLGRSVDSVRAQHDPTYMRAHIWAPTRQPDPEMLPDENDLSSPHPKAPGLKVEILALLREGPWSAETLAMRLNRPVNSIRARLDRLMDEFLVCHDGRYPRSWVLANPNTHVTGCEIQGKAGG